MRSIRYIASHYLPIAVLATLFLSSCSGETKKDETTNENQQSSINKEDSVAFVDREDWFVDETVSNEQKVELLKAFESGERNFDFYATFTEPFWTFYFFGNQVLFHSIESEVPLIGPLEYPFNDTSEEQTLKFTMNDKLWELKVTRKKGSDGMSDLVYPYTVEWRSFQGGGAINFVKEE